MARPVARPEVFAARFWARVAKLPSGCWEWTGCVNQSGYGWVNVPGSGPDRAHRVSWRLTHGEIERGACVLHRCDNRKCANPNHLFLGTKHDNTADMISKGREIGPPLHIGPMHPRTKLTAEHVRAIRALSASRFGPTRIAVILGDPVTAKIASDVIHGRTWSHLK